MHAVLLRAEFKQDWSGDPDAELDQLIGFVKSTPGFVRGTWTRDGERGLSLILFDSESVARGFADNAGMPPDASGVLRSVEVYEVAREV